MEVFEIKRRQIYELLYAPLDKYEKADRIAKILNKTKEEIIEEEKILKGSKSLISDLEEVYSSLFKKEEGDINENQKSR